MVREIAMCSPKSQWVQSKDGISLYYVFVDCPFESISSNRLLQSGEEQELYVEPPPEAPVEATGGEEVPEREEPEAANNDPESEDKSSKNENAGDKGLNDSPPDNGCAPEQTPHDIQPENKPEPQAWNAIVCNNNEINHPGSLLLHVQRPYAIVAKKHEFLDNRPIPSGEVYNLELEDVDIYIDIKESLTTGKSISKF
jgi:hypothetical protein